MHCILSYNSLKTLYKLNKVLKKCEQFSFTNKLFFLRSKLFSVWITLFYLVNK